MRPLDLPYDRPCGKAWGWRQKGQFPSRPCSVPTMPWAQSMHREWQHVRDRQGRRSGPLASAGRATSYSWKQMPGQEQVERWAGIRNHTYSEKKESPSSSLLNESFKFRIADFAQRTALEDGIVVVVKVRWGRRDDGRWSFRRSRRHRRRRLSESRSARRGHPAARTTNRKRRGR